MKKALKFISLSITVLLLGACEKSAFLDKAPLSFTSPQNFYKELSDFEIALSGCYQMINARELPGDDVSEGTYNTGLQYMLSAGTDELSLNSAGGGLDAEKFAVAQYTSTNTAIGDFWKAYYAGIMRCNLLIQKSTEVNFDGQSKGRLDEIIAEARFLRAFYYYHFAILFGGVPLNTTASPDPLAPRVNLKTLYSELIIPDLIFGYQSLPHRATVSGGANKWTAAGYLGVVYNYLASCKRSNVNSNLNFELNSFSWVDEGQMSNSAKIVLQDVLDHSGYKLTSNYDYLFRETTKAAQYEECLFLAENSNQITATYPSLVKLFAPGGDVNTYGGTWWTHRPTNEFVLKYGKDLDKRLNHNITLPFGGTPAVPDVIINGIPYCEPKPSTGVPHWQNNAAKFRHVKPSAKTIPLWASGISIPLLRYADIMLQYSEALYFTGSEPAARLILSDVRKRVIKTGKTLADLNTYYYKADFITELLEERSRELCFESKRRIDLIRFGKMTAYLNSLSHTPPLHSNYRVQELKSNWKEYKIWFPLPQRELDLNVNLSGHQNPGY